MKFDKETLIGIGICLIVLFGWSPFSRYMGWSPTPKAAETQTVNIPSATTEKSGKTLAEPSAVSSGHSSVAEPAVTAKKEVVSVIPKLPPVFLENDFVKLEIDPVAGAVRFITLKKYQNSTRTSEIRLDETSGGSGALSFFDPDDAWSVLSAVEVSKTAGKLTVLRHLQNKFGQKFAVRQSWELADGYEVRTEAEFANPGKSPLMFRNLVLDGGDLAAWAVLSGDRVRSPSHRLDYMTAEGSLQDISAGVSDEKFFRDGAIPVKWVGLGNKYFVTILTANDPFLLYRSRKKVSLDGAEVEILTAGAKLNDWQLAPGGRGTLAFRSYAGPKVIRLLDTFDPAVGKVMHLAWGPLDYLARFLLWVLIKMHSVLGSYGWSIILLTLLVRILFYPATAKANSSMKKMQSLQPKMQALREKYKDNPQLLNAKTMELYREEKVNPFGGCLPILLQIPVFFALYATLDGAVELRQESFLWINDLAAADTIAVIPLYFYNLPLNPLVLAMTGLMVLQQRMMPSSMEPAQQKMMLAMPVVMLIFMYDMPSGLTLYWTVSNIFSILQLKLQQRNNLKQAAAPVAKA